MRDEPIDSPRKKVVGYVLSRVEEFDHFAVAIDSPPYHRKLKLPDYKSGRDEKPASFYEERLRCIEDLTALGVHLFAVDGYEADDICAALVCDDALANAVGDHDWTILSSDKDLFQLLDPSVHQVSLQTGKTITVDSLRERWDITPAQVQAFLALMGDSADNIPGVKGIGPKKATELLAKHGDIDGLLHDLQHAATQFTPALATNLRNAAPNLRLWQELCTLDRAVDIDALRMLKPIVATGEAAFNPDQRHEEDPMHKDEYEDDRISEVGAGPDEADPGPPERESAPRTTAALATVAPRDWSKQLEPRDWSEAWRAAGMVVAARMFTNKFGSREQTCVVIMAGRARGLDMWTSLDGISIVKGNPFFSSALIIGMAQSHHECIYLRPVGEQSATSATWETMRRGWTEPLSMSYTIEQARLAGLVQRNTPWETRPAEMLLKQAGRVTARAAFSDIVGGLYDPEEIAEQWEQVAS
jgi:5'-3' exonuclease